jgi:2-aminoethylphosphonate-pyruvate transaminase
MSKSKENILFCPGPVNVAQNVWQAVYNHIGHREEEFSELMARLNQRVLDVFEIKNQTRYHPLIITGSGTAANETVLSSIGKDKKVLVITNGEFGERLYNISKLHNRNTRRIAFNWAEVIDIAKVDAYLQKHKVDLIVMVHHETSTGMLNPVAVVGKLAKKYGVQFFVDTVSSASAEKVDIEKWNITYCSTSSGKAIGALPGIGIIIADKKALETLKDTPQKIMYLNLYKLYHYSKSCNQTPNTPAVHLFSALDQALGNILATGVQERRKIIAERAFVLRNGLKKLGFHFLLDEMGEAIMSSVLTTVVLPPYMSADYLKQKLKERRIVIYSGKGPLMDKVFQVANIGELTKHDLVYFLHTLEKVCLEAKRVQDQNLAEVPASAQAGRFAFLSNYFHLPHHRSKTEHIQ